MDINELYAEINNIIPVKESGNDFQSTLKNALSQYEDIIEKFAPSMTRLGINKNSLINEIKNINTGLQECVQLYFDSSHSKAYDRLNACILYKIKDITESYIIHEGDKFYRARTFKDNKTYTFEDMFHIPLSQRGTISTQRYSYPGHPCLYLGTSIKVCWEELGRPEFEKLGISRFVAKRNFLLLNLTIPQLSDFTNQNISKLLARLPLIIACSICVDNPNNKFKQEYIIPQLVTEQLITMNKTDYKNGDKALEELNVGVIYTSTHIPNNSDLSKITFNNIAIPVFDTTEKDYCQMLATCFDWTNPICYEEIADETPRRLRKSDILFKIEKLEKKLNSLELHRIPHLFLSKPIVRLGYQAGSRGSVPVFCDNSWKIKD